MADELHVAAGSKQGFLQVKHLIEERKADINEPHSMNGSRPVDFAAQSGSLTTLIYLLRKKVNLNARTRHNILYWALFNSKEVLGYIADPANRLIEKFQDGTTQLHAFAAAGRLDEVNKTLRNDSSMLFVTDLNGRNALVWAVHAGQYNVADYLIAHPEFQSIHDDVLRDTGKQLIAVAKHLEQHEIEASASKAYSYAKNCYDKIKEKSSHDYFQIALCYSTMEDMMEDDSRIAMDYLIQAISNIEKIDPRTVRDERYVLSNLGALHSRLGQLHIKQKNFKDGIKYVVTGIQFYKDIKAKVEDDHFTIAELSHYLAKVHVRLNQFEQAEIEFNHATQHCYYMNHGTLTKEEYLNEILLSQTKAKEYQQFYEAFKKLGYECTDVEPDGSCFFYSVVDQFAKIPVPSYTALTHLELRNKVVDRIKKYSQVYKDFMFEDPIDKYMEKMRLPEEWADHLAISVASREFNITIVILYTNREPTIIKREAPIATVFLASRDDVHFLSLQYRPEWGVSQEALLKKIAEAPIDDFKETVDEEKKPESLLTKRQREDDKKDKEEEILDLQPQIKVSRVAQTLFAQDKQSSGFTIVVEDCSEAPRLSS